MIQFLSKLPQLRNGDLLYQGKSLSAILQNTTQIPHTFSILGKKTGFLLKKTDIYNKFITMEINQLSL